MCTLPYLRQSLSLNLELGWWPVSLSYLLLPSPTAALVCCGHAQLCLCFWVFKFWSSHLYSNCSYLLSCLLKPPRILCSKEGSFKELPWPGVLYVFLLLYLFPTQILSQFLLLFPDKCSPAELYTSLAIIF